MSPLPSHFVSLLHTAMANFVILSMLATSLSGVFTEAFDPSDSTGSLTASQADWDELSLAVEGRLFAANPMAEPCFAGQSSTITSAFDSAACLQIRTQYTNESEGLNFTSILFGG